MRHFVEMLDALSAEQVEFLLIGGYALASYAAPRATGDFDIWVRPSHENAARVFRALAKFGAPVAAHGVTADDFARGDNVCQIGLPPQRIDIVTSISGVEFEAARLHRMSVTFLGRSVAVISRDDFIQNKRASGWPKDLLDVLAIEDVMRAEREPLSE